jgi:tetratricopeptide (TPR) repeat protein
MTVAYQCSLAEYLSVVNPSVIGKPRAFISHAWISKFKDLVEALVTYFGEDEYVLLDFVCNNQHKAPDHTFEWWCGTFKNAIASIGKTVMVFDSWDDPIPLTRGWCIWELHCTIDNDLCEFDIAMTTQSESSFVKDMDESAVCINKMLTTINCERSECFKVEDRLQIHDAVKRTVGFSKMNETIFEVMRTWIRKYEKEMENRKGELGEMHPDTLLSMNNLAILCMNQGLYEKSEPLFMECLEKHKSVTGDDHPDTLTSMNNLAEFYRDQGKYQKSEPFYVECLKKMKSILGDGHPDTLMVMNNLAVFYSDQGRFEKAELLYLECLEKSKSVLGDVHPDTFHSMNNLAGLYQRQAKYEKAELLYVECLEKSKSVLGDVYPDTLTVLNNLATLYKNQGNYEKAEPLHLECLTKRKSILGDLHPETLHSINNLAGVYTNKRNLGQSEALRVDCLEKLNQF